MEMMETVSAGVVCGLFLLNSLEIETETESDLR